MVRAFYAHRDVVDVIVFRLIKYGLILSILVIVALFAAYKLEPRSDAHKQKLEALETRLWVNTDSFGGSRTEFSAKVVLPNGKEHTFIVKPDNISAERYLCALIEKGDWLGIDHITVVQLSECALYPQSLSNYPQTD